MARSGIYRQLLVIFPWRAFAVLAVLTSLTFLSSAWEHEHEHATEDTNAHESTDPPEGLHLDRHNTDLLEDLEKETHAHDILHHSSKLPRRIGHDGDFTQLERAPRYVVDLDASPHNRWKEVVNSHFYLLEDLSQFIGKIATMLSLKVGVTSAVIRKRVTKVSRNQTANLFHEDVEALSDLMNIPAWKLFLLQFVYEASSHCSSVMATTQDDGTLLHARTLDWDAGLLKRLTIELDFRRGGETVFVATSWIGYVGVLTGMKPKAFAVSSNFRQTESDSNLYEAVQQFSRGRSLVGYLLRQVLQSKQVTLYEQVVSRVMEAPLVSSCYVAVNGPNPKHAAIITRDATRYVRPIRCVDETAQGMKAESGQFEETADSLVQTNVDPDVEDTRDDVLNSIARKSFLLSALGAESRQGQVKDRTDMWRLITSAPVFMDYTLYATVMDVAGGTLETRLQVT